MADNLPKLYQPVEERRKDFLAEYVRNGYDAKAAYAKIFPDASESTWSTNGATFLKHPRTQALLNEIRAKVMAKIEVDEKRIIEELARIAFLDPGQWYDEDGNLLPLADMPEDARRAIEKLETEYKMHRGDDEPSTLKKISGASKLKALELLGRHLAMFTDKVEHSGSSDLASAILAARSRTVVRVDSATSVTVQQADAVTVENARVFQ